MPTLEISVASLDDVRLMGRWAADEGWNPGRDDRFAFLSADPQGFLMGRVGGVPAACISVVRYEAGHGFLGFYIAREPFRGKGFGLQIWQAGMRRMAGRNVGLDGVVERQADYRASGFTTAWSNVRFAGVPAPQEALPDVQLVDARSLPFDAVAAYDRRFFPAARDSFLACWLSLPDRQAIAAVRDGQIAGLGVARPSETEYRVGPLYGESPQIVALILSRLPAPLTIDVPDINPAAIKLVTRQGMQPQFETARMYTAGAPRIDLSGLFGVTSLELG